MIIIVEIYKANWCGFCQDFMETTVNDDLRNDLAKHDVVLVIHELTTSETAHKRAKPQIMSYPTIQCNGVVYRGRRDRASIVAWAREQCAAH